MKTLGFYNKKLVDVSNIVIPILIYSLEQHKTQANISKTTRSITPVITDPIINITIVKAIRIIAVKISIK